ncbi:MAG: prolipoprotein diacylglyceryl transferase [Anaerolineae bacterium]
MVDPVLIQLGPFAIRWYGVLVIGGAVIAAYFCARGAERRGLDPEYVWDMLIWVLFTGIVGARLYHVFSSAGGQVGWDYYRQNPLEALKIWKGGLAIYGALIGGFFGLATYVWYRKLDLVQWMDIVFPNVLIAQAIGRWGNLVNQEAYGPPTDLPWAIYIAPSHRLPGYEQYSHFHPLFLYESIWTFAGWLLLGWLSRRFPDRLKKGDLTALYFLWYPLGRFFIEGLRVDAWRVGAMPAAQWISLAAIVLSVAFLVIRRVLPSSAKADLATR